MNSDRQPEELEPTPLDLRNHSEELASYNYKTDFQKGHSGSTSFLHEHTHFLDHISTPYGYFLDSLTAVYANACKELLSYFNSQGAPSLPIPLRKCFRDMQALEELLRTEAEKEFKLRDCMSLLGVFVVVWPLLVNLERALEGISLPTIYELDPASALGGIRIFEAIDEYFDRHLPADLDLVINLELEDWSAPETATPRIMRPDRNTRFLFGAISLLEGRAFFIERSLGFEKQDPLARADDQNRTEYFIVPLILAQRLIDIGEYNHELFFDTYLALADLALYTPIGRTYKTFRTENNWTEIHPGFRFEQLRQTLGKVGPFKRSEKLSVFEYQEGFCRELSWATPRDYLRKGAELDEPTYRASRHRAACRLKLNNPRLFVNPALEYLPLPNDEDLLSFWKRDFPFYVDAQDPERVFPFAGEIDTPRLMERLSMAYLLSLGWSLIMLGDPDSKEHLDPEFPYHKFVKWPTDGSLSQFFDSVCRKNVRVRPIL